MVKIDWGLLSSRRNKISNIPICPENTHSLCRLNMSVKPRCAEGNLSLPPITTICHYRRSMQMIDRADLLWWQKHRDRSPGPTVVIMHGPDPAGKNPDVHLVFLLRFELYRFGLSWKPHNDIPKLPSINFMLLMWVLHVFGGSNWTRTVYVYMCFQIPGQVYSVV